GVDQHADGVEPEIVEERAIGRLHQPRRRHAPHLAALGLVQGLPRRAGADPRRLDLAEHEHVALRHDEVELAPAGAVVAGRAGAAAADEVLGGERLAAAPEAAAGIGAGHAATLWPTPGATQRAMVTTSCRKSYRASCWYAIDANDMRCSGETPSR